MTAITLRLSVWPPLYISPSGPMALLKSTQLGPTVPYQCTLRPPQCKRSGEDITTLNHGSLTLPYPFPVYEHDGYGF